MTKCGLNAFASLLYFQNDSVSRFVRMLKTNISAKFEKSAMILNNFSHYSLRYKWRCDKCLSSLD